MISEALPRTTVGPQSQRARAASAVRTGSAPTATGSSTHGVPASSAAAAASSIAVALLGVRACRG